MIYLDNASTTRVNERYKSLILDSLFNNYGNPGSVHCFGAKAKEIVEQAREKVALGLGANSGNIIFTSGGSEANTLAILGMENHLKKYNLNHIITSTYEHHSVLNAMKEMERRGFDVTYLDVSKNGVIKYEDFVEAVRDDTGFVSIMYVNNELGTINDVEKIYSFCKSREIVFHSDCVQAIGSVPVCVGITADMISISGHKINAPKGVGCLCTLYKDFLSNIIFGGQQEFGLRPGTENVAYVSVFGNAVFDCVRNIESHTNAINGTMMCFCTKIIEECEKNDISFCFNVPRTNKTCKIVSMSFHGIDAETLVLLLGKNGVCVSSGAACSSHSSKPSHVLKSIGLSDDDARSTIRISFSTSNTCEEVAEAANIIVRCVKFLKSLKPSFYYHY